MSKPICEADFSWVCDSITVLPVYGEDNGLTLIELRGLDYDDPLWDDLSEQLTKEDYYNTIGLFWKKWLVILQRVCITDLN